MIEIRSLSKSFGKKEALKDVSFKFENAVYGMLGPNGAGKTTLIRLLAQVYPDKRNSILYNGSPISKNKEYMNKLGYLPQLFGAFKELRVTDMMRMMANLKGTDKANSSEDIDRCLKLVNLYEQREAKVGALSGGMVRRLGIAQTMLGDPEIVIFDEPTAGLDPEERLRFKNIISENKDGKTIIISTHIVEDVEALCDRIAVMNDGNILVSGSRDEIRRLAGGKVYQLPESRLSEIKGEYHVQKQTDVSGEKEVRLLSATEQAFSPAEPTVEDGYICAVNHI